ncbi:capsule biosynthesis GfcC family protein [Paraglaciecola polaris]|uniref:capsule biosynthesis GfcC family protein n=1 Tax=Paraglaciecola polaris TaxID=222814 RepID=UPI0030EE37E1|tara:strand:+ start:6285 stop:7019 length:735 start_codon:yes stop_codon:yes gene_type:complete
MKSYLTLAALAACFLSAELRAEVTLTWGDESYTYPSSVRLSDALAPLADQNNIYWPAAALYQSNSEIEKTRQALLDNLNIIKKRFSADDTSLLSATDQLMQVVSSWQVAKRSPIAIDIDLARIQPAKNPLLIDGRYILGAGPRSKTVFIFGAVEQTLVVAHQPHTDVSEYVASSARISAANQDYVYIIQTDGRVILAPSAYWNKHHQEAMPGSMLFVPFNESLFHPEFERINTLLVSLATNRVL